MAIPDVRRLEEVVPWIVFAPQAEVRSVPSFFFLAEKVGLLPKGASIVGRRVMDDTSGTEWLCVERDGALGYVSLTQLHRIYAGNVCSGNLPIGSEFVNRWWGIPLEYEPDDMERVPPEWTTEPERVFQLRTEPLGALLAMLEAARGDGLEIRLNSAYRSGAYQQGLFENAIRRDGNGQRYSAPPGHSEHQLGTTVDLTDVKSEFAFTQDFGATPEGQWLARNAGRFGFVRTYRDDNTAETGYIPEPWHWRYHGVGSV